MKILNENPDFLKFKNKSLSRFNSDVYTFGYYRVGYSSDGNSGFKYTIKFLIGKFNYHGFLRDDEYEKNQEKNNGSYTYPERLGDRETFDGRFWLNSKVISVWDGIDKRDLERLIKDIYANTKIKIADDWYIEYKNNKFKKIGDYLGHHSFKHVPLGDRHLLSPVLKTKTDIDGFGSDKYDKLASKYYQYDTVAQMNYYLKNKYHEHKKLELQTILERLIKASDLPKFEVGYHVAPISARNSIQKFGLDYSKSSYGRDSAGDDVYLFLDYDEAIWYKRVLKQYNQSEGENEDFEIWKINLKGMKLKKDFTLNSGNNSDSAFFTNGPISKNKLKLMK